MRARTSSMIDPILSQIDVYSSFCRGCGNEFPEEYLANLNDLTWSFLLTKWKPSH